MEREESFGVTPIVKCVGLGCNLRCRYCFYRQEPRASLVMPLPILKHLIRETYRVNQHDGPIEFIWHGGEPMIAGKGFYENVLKLQRMYDREGNRAVNGIQTNGTLIDTEWAEFFRKHDFQVGISLDGPQKYHDQYRQYPNGRGSFEDTMKGIEVLKVNEVPFGIVSVITAVTVHRPEDIFRFFVENKLYNIKFSRALGRNDAGELSDFAPSPDEYGNFLLKMLELWLEEDNPKIRITPIVEIFSSLIQGKSCAECLFANVCDRFWIVSSGGDVYACPSEGRGEKWHFGNIANGFESIMESSVFQEFQKLVRELRKPCLKCKWYEVCRGGCTIDYELESPSFKKRNVLCVSLQWLFRRAKEKLAEYNLIEK